VKLLKRKFVTG
jgi:hypothetical protein